MRWPHGPNCPHCGNVDASKIAKVEGKNQNATPTTNVGDACDVVVSKPQPKNQPGKKI